MLSGIKNKPPGTTIYSVVYREPGKVAPRVKQDLNAFLSLWLRNLTAQGHRLVQS